MLMNTAEYLSIIENIKSEITAAQYRAAVHVNADMLLLYYDIGQIYFGKAVQMHGCQREFPGCGLW